MPPTTREGAAAVYMPSCVNRIFGRDSDGAAGTDEPESLPAALVAVSLRAGRPLWIPTGIAGSCCGTPWVSKGYGRGAEWMAAETVADLWRWSGGGELPVVIDATSCTQGIIDSAALLAEADAERLSAIRIVDSVTWARELLPSLEIGERVGTAIVHPTCSGIHLGVNGDLVDLAGALADEVIVPEAAGCCGFAGDRGFLHPELTASATAAEASQAVAAGGDAHLCSNRTCEIGMSRATGRDYESFVYLLERLSR